MKTMRKCNDEIYQLAKDQALVKKLKKNNKRFRPFCLWCNVCNSRIQKLSFFSLWFSFQLGLWSMIYILDLPKSSNECPGDTKCWLTGKSIIFVWSLLCPFILLLNGWTLSPTYCDPQTCRRNSQGGKPH
jgi:hypothetical protein